MTLGSHQQTVGKSQIHLTPRFIIDALGPFDLDPCAADPRPWDCARVNFTEADDGLAQLWARRGRVWLNPPFNRYYVARWIEKLADHGDGIALLHARTETEWFRPIWQRATAMLFLFQRLTFCRPDGTPCGVIDKRTGEERPANSGAPVVLIAFGEACAARLEAAQHGPLPGALVREWRTPRPADPGAPDNCASEASQPAMSARDEPSSPPKPPVEGA